MWTGWKSILLSDDCLWKVFSGSGTRSVNHIFRELIRWALPKHEWGCAISHPSEEHSRAWVFPSFILTVFCLAFASSQAEAFVCPWEVGVRYETYTEIGLSWLTGPTHIPKMRYSPGQTRVLRLRGRPFKDDQRRVTVLNLVAKHDSPPLLKNTTLKSIGGPRGEAEMAGSNRSPHFCRISPSSFGEETFTTPGFCVIDSVINSGQFGHFPAIALKVPCPRQALRTRQTKTVGHP